MLQGAVMGFKWLLMIFCVANAFGYIPLINIAVGGLGGENEQ